MYKYAYPTNVTTINKICTTRVSDRQMIQLKPSRYTANILSISSVTYVCARLNETYMLAR